MGFSEKRWWLGFATLVLPVCSAQTAQAFDGRWWAITEPEERVTFLLGADDCLHWTIHAAWLTRDVDNLEKEVDKYYRSHEAERSVSVLDVWRKVLRVAPPAAPPLPGGEVYTNPHGYYDGQYWRELSDSERRRFIEGYVSCLRSDASSPRETYSQPVDVYVARVSEYVDTNVRAVYESIASLLARFKDSGTAQPTGKSTRR